MIPSQRPLPIVLTVLLAAAAACGAEATGPSATKESAVTERPGDTTPGDDAASKDGTASKGDATPGDDTASKDAADKAPGAPDDICPGNALYDFVFQGEGLSAWDGHRVVVVALESKSPETSVELTTVVRLSGEIRSGTVDLACDDSLSESYGYARVAAYIDVNGDGACTPDEDVGAMLMRYGWKHDVCVSTAEPPKGEPQYIDDPSIHYVAFSPWLVTANFCTIFN